MKFRTHALSLPLAALIVIPAQAQQWTVERTESGCPSATRTVGPERTSVSGRDRFGVSVSFPVEGDITRNGAWPNPADFTLRPLRGPALTGATLGFNANYVRGTQQKPLFDATAYLQFDATQFSAVAAASPTVELVAGGRSVASFLLAGLAEARAALAACTPLLPPPNRPPQPRGRPDTWVSDQASLERYTALAGTLDATAPFAATIIVNSQGGIDSCTVSQSTGVPAIDDLMCANVRRRGRFSPATNGESKYIAGAYSYRAGPIQFKSRNAIQITP